MELTKEESQRSKGIAILGMLMLHLFCRIENLPYTPWIWIGQTPLIYYVGLFGDLCVPVYSFCSGYAQALLRDREGKAYRSKRLFRLAKFILNYWIVLVLFSVVGLLVDPSGTIPGSLSAFLGNLFLYRISYNGAWWYVLTYVLLILLSPVVLRLTKQLHPIVLFLGSGIVYFVSYVFRFAVVLELPGAIGRIWEQVILLGTTQFAFVVGILFYQKKIITRLRSLHWKPIMKNTVCILIPAAMFFVHSVERSLIIAPITGLSTMVCFQLADNPAWLNKAALFLGKYSTNIWLVLMFFYLVLFDGLVFYAEYPLFVVALLAAISILVSIPIEMIFSRLCQKIKWRDLSCQR